MPAELSSEDILQSVPSAPPRANWGRALFVAAFVSEGLSVVALLDPGQWGGRLVAPWWGWHVLGVSAALMSFRFRFPASYQSHPWLITVLVLGFVMPAPLAGLFFVWLFQSLLTVPREERASRRYYFGERHVLTAIPAATGKTRQNQSVLEVLSGRDNQVRRKAILALRSVDPRRAIPVLQKAIQDGDDQVRLLAQTQYNRIQASIELTVKSLEAEIQGGHAPAPHYIQLAEQYHELVFLGLSGEEAQYVYLGRASELLQQALKMDPRNQPARLLLLKCLVRSKKLDEAVRELEELKRMGVREEILMPWESDIHYQRREWKDLRRCLASLRANSRNDLRLRAPVEFWLGPELCETTASNLGTPA